MISLESLSCIHQQMLQELDQRLSAGKKVSVSTRMRMTPNQQDADSGVRNRKRPYRRRNILFRCPGCPRWPASESFIRKRPPQHCEAERKRCTSRCLRSSRRRPKPLFPSRRGERIEISESPCAPGLAIAQVPNGLILEIAVKMRMISGKSEPRTASPASPRIPRFFLPRYSGVRPTIRPAMKTVSTTKIIMPYMPEPTPPKITSPNEMLIRRNHSPRRSKTNRACH